MDPKFYCDAMHSELVALKSKISDIYRAMENLPPDIKFTLMGQTSELHTLMEELTVKINELKKIYPSEIEFQK